jgi:hypothetical protein
VTDNLLDEWVDHFLLPPLIIYSLLDIVRCVVAAEIFLLLEVGPNLRLLSSLRFLVKFVTSPPPTQQFFTKVRDKLELAFW